jgi:hypothetical protein
MSKKYLIKNLGIGDLIFFCGSILAEHKENESVEYFLSKDVLRLYRENNIEYEKFCHEYIKYFLPNHNLIVLNNESETNYVWTVDYLRDNKILNSNSVVDSIKEKLTNSKNTLNQDNYIVIFTKSRDLDLGVFSKVSTNFFSSINNFDGKIILLGEREVKYTGEYAIHGRNKIYSIYNDCIKYINQDKIIDLTTQNYSFSDFSLNKILQDCKIISDSFKTYIFGGGGFFCLSIFTDKLVSLTNDTYKNAFHTERNKNLFSDVEQFKSFISNE